MIASCTLRDRTLSQNHTKWMPHNSCSSNFSSDRPSILTSNGDRSFFSLPSLRDAARTRPLRPSRFDSHAH
ncbi:hypothetical protein [Nostoc sp.]|uniref:hypothetical protein n=1 Tax=Nostoc sp. TaxID=1180 RepID=UPI002FFB5B7C